MVFHHREHKILVNENIAEKTVGVFRLTRGVMTVTKRVDKTVN